MLTVQSGMANFTALQFVDGPPGTYTLEFSAAASGVSAKVSHVATIYSMWYPRGMIIPRGMLPHTARSPVQSTIEADLRRSNQIEHHLHCNVISATWNIH